MKWFIFTFVFLLFVFASFLFWLRYGRPFTPLRVGQIQIDGQVIEVELADTVVSRGRGLSGRNGLPLGYGMLFVFPAAGQHGFWMQGMKFPLDFVWIKGSQVVGVTEQVYPEFKKPIWQLTIYKPPQEVDKVLEVPSGAVALYGWRKGSVVLFPDSGVK
jgi:uncharacterized membrane protein (UPF0127 family)